MIDRVLGAPVEAVPLYAVLAVLHDWAAGLPANTCLSSSFMISRALGHLGFDASMLAAYVAVCDLDDAGRVLASIGLADRVPTADPDGSLIDGHVVVWAASFHRLVDATVVQIPVLRAAAESDEVHQLPVVSPISQEELFAARPTLERRPYRLVYRLFQNALDGIAAALAGQNRDVLDYGALQLAHTSLDLIKLVRGYRDIRALNQQYPQLRELLADRAVLPPMPPTEPPAMQSLRAAFPDYDRRSPRGPTRPPRPT